MIFTFYSYKGGVGRTMALVNIAEYLYDNGKHVLIVDWDLESPGVATYFPEMEPKSRKRKGVLDLILNYKETVEKRLPPENLNVSPFGNVADCVLNIYPFAEGKGNLQLISTGLRDDEHIEGYIHNLRGIDWNDLIQNKKGAEYFGWLRNEFLKLAPIVLIDAPSGMSEMAGVCTNQLADVVVAFTTPNKQSVEGTKGLVKRLKSAQDYAGLSDKENIVAIIVPSRIENSELKKRNEFESLVHLEFDNLLPTSWSERNKSFWDLRIPYVPLYAFDELIAMRESRDGGEHKAAELVKAYQILWDFMSESPSSKGLPPKEEIKAILVVEGVEGWQKILQNVIEKKMGQKTVFEKSIDKALALLESFSYEGVVLNLTLGQANMDYEGVKVLEQIKDAKIDVPVIVLTSDTVSTKDIYRRYESVRDILYKGSGSGDFVNQFMKSAQSSFHLG